MALNRQSGRSGSTTFAEHPRALLLPQEVKEIGTDSALIFYEGLRPIRCKKIRYYADRRFRARLLAPPRHATPGGPRKNTPLSPSAAPVTAAASASASAPAPADAEPLMAAARSHRNNSATGGIDARCGRQGHRAVGFA